MSIWKHRPKPTPPPAPQQILVNVWVTDGATDAGIPNAAIDCLSFDPPEDGRTNQDGYFGLMLQSEAMHTIEVHADGYNSAVQTFTLPLRSGTHDERFALVRAASPISKAGQRGKLECSTEPIFRVNGQPWRWLACDGFALPLLHAMGENIDPVLDWAIATGFVALRCFFGLHYIAQQMGRTPWLATPATTRAFLETLRARELRCEWTVGDMQLLMADAARQRVWYDGQIDVLKDYADLTTAETCNESFKNGVDTAAIGRFGHGIIQTSGNYAPPCNPRLDYGVTHVPRDAEWPRKSKELFDLYQGFDPDLPGGVRIPWVGDEAMGADEVNKPGSRSNVPEDFFDDAAVAALMGAGGTFHATDLIFGRVPGPTQQRCAEMYVAGSRAIPVDAALGQYTRGGLNESPLEHDDAQSLRTFARISGNRATAIAVRPQPTWRPVARNGWTISSTTGPNDRVVTLVR